MMITCVAAIAGLIFAGIVVTRVLPSRSGLMALIDALIARIMENSPGLLQKCCMRCFLKEVQLQRRNYVMNTTRARRCAQHPFYVEHAKRRIRIART
jgi:hypothetical protein